MMLLKKRSETDERLSVHDLEKRLSGSNVNPKRFLPTWAFKHNVSDPKSNWIENFKVVFYPYKQRDGKMLARVKGEYKEFYHNGSEVGKRAATRTDKFTKWVVVPTDYFYKSSLDVPKGDLKSKAAILLYGKGN